MLYVLCRIGVRKTLRDRIKFPAQTVERFRDIGIEMRSLPFHYN